MTDVIMRSVFMPERNTGWMEGALCAGDNSDTWFPSPPSYGTDREWARYNADVAFAQSICAECPIRAGCLADAERRGERFGIWGGVNFYVPRRKGIKDRAEARAS